MFSYIDATPAERAKIEKMLISWISSDNVKSVIVKVFCLQTLSNFAMLTVDAYQKNARIADQRVSVQL